MPVATIEAAPASPEENSSRSTSATWRLGADSGSTRSSGSDKTMLRNGAPRKSSTAMAAAATGMGRRMTKMAMRCQNPSECSSVERLKIVSLSTLCPSTARMAGNTTTAKAPARKATATPA